MSDHLGARLATFCALLPLADAAAARAEIEGWPPEAESPFAAVPGTHFGRLVILERLERQVAEQPPDELSSPYLVLSAFFDAPAEAWLDALADATPGPLERALRCCRGFPGPGGPALTRWLEAHRAPATAIFGAYPDATVDEVRAALAFRERFRAFAFELEAARSGQAAFLGFAEREARA